jgi:prevent-host-death family protein
MRRFPGDFLNSISSCRLPSTCLASHSCRVLPGYEYDEVVSMPRTMSAAEFKAKCLQAMEQVAATGEPIIVTKRGKPVAQLAPVAKKSKSLRGFLKGSVKSGKDIISPIICD